MRPARSIFSVLAVACLVASACGGGNSSGVTAPQRSAPLSVGDAAPSFTARDQNGRVRTLSEFQGHAVVLYFYPADATPGCTREACAFRDAWQRIQDVDAIVIGVSTNTVESHADFAEEERLPFPLLADPDEVIVGAYGVSTTLGLAHRMTYIIDARGHIARVYPDVDPGVHVEEVLTALNQMRGNSS